MQKTRIDLIIQILCAIAGLALILTAISCFINDPLSVNGIIASVIGAVLIAMAKGFKNIELIWGKLKLCLS